MLDIDVEAQEWKQDQAARHTLPRAAPVETCWAPSPAAQTKAEAWRPLLVSATLIHEDEGHPLGTAEQ
ncbi:hypothetical protein VULLAG_LOCUS14077 [Vulpes lagopus]